jgi:hypothetical protein
VRWAPRGASVMYAVCCVTAPGTFLSFFSSFSFSFVTRPPCASFTHMALFVFPVIPRMTQVFPFCSLPTPKLYANFLLVPIFVVSYRLMPSIVASVFCIFHCSLNIRFCIIPPLRRRRIFPYVSSYYRSTFNLTWTLLLFSCT